eukprot:TRINITY_DN69256_c0_g1_i1.p1 TRINITY_DN69256_c0_g1~~TRINITY_DN69256_c0_g1_i1.p1  ORF type:complete len:226 (-),score=28.14 TRINITY_DN69256_c0_g1_i1:135-812(-)
MNVQSCLVGAAAESDAVAAPVQQAFGLDGSPGISIEPLRREELNTELMKEIGSLYHDGFGGKRCCLCFHDSESSTQENSKNAYTKFPTSKLEACAVARDADGHAIGLAQLGFKDTPGDWEMPSFLVSKPKQGTGHLERIVVGAKARGKGVGTQLLDWVDNKCRDRGCERVKLEVVSGNPAKKLYERHGYVTVTGTCARCAMCPLIYCLMGHLYADTMVKPLRGSQ